MKDEALERVWKSRRTISARCDFDAHKLVKYYQERRKAKGDRAEESNKPRASGLGSGR